jgi:hypothetical protein
VYCSRCHRFESNSADEGLSGLSEGFGREIEGQLWKGEAMNAEDTAGLLANRPNKFIGSSAGMGD